MTEVQQGKRREIEGVLLEEVSYEGPEVQRALEVQEAMERMDTQESLKRLIEERSYLLELQKAGVKEQVQLYSGHISKHSVDMLVRSYQAQIDEELEKLKWESLVTNPEELEGTYRCHLNIESMSEVFSTKNAINPHYPRKSYMPVREEGIKYYRVVDSKVPEWRFPERRRHYEQIVVIDEEMMEVLAEDS